MAGQRQRHRDQAGIYRAKARGLARAHGYDLDEVWTLWEQLAGCHEFEFVARMPREVHEQSAWRLIEAIYLKQGEQGD
jgi:hypothetical protein